MENLKNKVRSPGVQCGTHISHSIRTYRQTTAAQEYSGHDKTGKRKAEAYLQRDRGTYPARRLTATGI